MLTVKVKARMTCLAFMAFTLVSITQIQPLFAWESDVHYGLTHWLGMQAGFDYEQAREIASGDQSIDDEWDTAPVWLGIKVIFANSKESSQTLSDNHFPTTGHIPDDPPNRPVEKDSVAAQKGIDRELNIPYRMKPSRALRDFGRALHAFQDSWSHQGQPDVPLRPVYSIKPQYAWSHPELRGGWASHDADLTAKHPRDALDMAHQTLIKLCLYHMRNFTGGNNEQCNWWALKYEVEKFVEATSKKAKYEWFLFHKMNNSDAIRSIDFTSLSGSNIGLGDVSLDVVPSIKVDMASVTLKEFIDAFLYKWIVEGDISTAAKLVSARGLAEQFTLLGFPDSKEEFSKYSRRWSEGFLALWLSDDHSDANRLHHGMDPEIGYNLSDDRNASNKNRMHFGSLIEAIEWKGGERYEILPMSTADNLFLNPSYAVVFRFIHAPRDAVVVVIQRAGRQWEIIRLLSVSAG